MIFFDSHFTERSSAGTRTASTAHAHKKNNDVMPASQIKIKHARTNM